MNVLLSNFYTMKYVSDAFACIHMEMPEEHLANETLLRLLYSAFKFVEN